MKRKKHNNRKPTPHNDNGHHVVTLSYDMDRWADDHFDGLGAFLGLVRAEQPAMQLSLFPAHCYGIELPLGGLAVDVYSGTPVTPKLELEAWRLLKRLPSWIGGGARVVKVEIHQTDDVPLYVVSA